MRERFRAAIFDVAVSARGPRVDIFGRDFTHGKPDPEIFTTVGQELGVPPRECLVVENAVAGPAGSATVSSRARCR